MISYAKHSYRAGYILFGVNKVSVADWLLYNYITTPIIKKYIKRFATHVNGLEHEYCMLKNIWQYIEHTSPGARDIAIT